MNSLRHDKNEKNKLLTHRIYDCKKNTEQLRSNNKYSKLFLPSYDGFPIILMTEAESHSS